MAVFGWRRNSHEQPTYTELPAAGQQRSLSI